MELKKLLSFLRVAATHPFKVGAITPSSRYSRAQVVHRLPKQCRVVIEYGPGTGNITRDILKNLGPGARLIAIEQSDNFIKELHTIKDKRLIIIHGDVRSFAGRLLEWSPGGVDAVVSGIAFSFLSPKERDQVVEETFHGLRSGGRFVVYQHSIAVLSTLKKYFPQVQTSFEIRNFPPYFIFTDSKV